MSQHNKSTTSGLSKGEDTIVAQVQQRIIQLNTLPNPLRTIVWGITTLLILIGIVIATQNLPQPHITITPSNQASASAPISVVIAGVLSFALALSCLLTGASYSQWYLRLRIPLLLILSYIFLIDTGYTFMSKKIESILATSYHGPGSEIIYLVIVQLALLIGLWVIVLKSHSPRSQNSVMSSLVPAPPFYYHYPDLPPIGPSSPFNTAPGPYTEVDNSRSYIRMFWLVFSILIIHFALNYWIAQEVGNMGGANYGVFGSIFIFWILLIPAIILAGTDIAEISEMVSGQIARLTRRWSSPPLFTALIIILFSGITVYNTWRLALAFHFSSTSGFFLMMAMLVGIGIVLATVSRGGLALLHWIGRMKNPEKWQSISVSLSSMLFSLLVFGIGLIVVGAVAQLIFHSEGSQTPLLMLISLIVCMISIVLFTVGRGNWPITGLYLLLLTIFGTIIIFLYTRPNGPLHPQSFLAPIAPAGLVACIWLVARQRSADAQIDNMRLFKLVISVQFIVLLADLIGFVGVFSKQFIIAQACVFVLAQLWDFWTSGEHVTNNRSAAFPRPARIFLYAGYVMLLVSFALTAGLNSKIAGAYKYGLDDGTLAQIGLFVLGVPLLLTNAFLDNQRSYKRARG